jgi:hypothetical protein
VCTGSGRAKRRERREKTDDMLALLFGMPAAFVHLPVSGIAQQPTRAIAAMPNKPPPLMVSDAQIASDMHTIEQIWMWSTPVFFALMARFVWMNERGYDRRYDRYDDRGDYEDRYGYGPRSYDRYYREDYYDRRQGYGPRGSNRYDRRYYDGDYYGMVEPSRRRSLSGSGRRYGPPRY